MTTKTLLLKPKNTITFYNKNKILNIDVPTAALFNYFDFDLEINITYYSDDTLCCINVKIEKATLLFNCDSYKLNV